MDAAPIARILVVDDEISVAILLEKYLQRVGYAVDVAHLSSDAWDRFRAAPEAYAAAVVDQGMPDSPGDELIERMLRANPSIAAVLTSGYPCEPSSPKVSFLQKPFLPQRLKELLDAALSGRRATA